MRYNRRKILLQKNKTMTKTAIKSLLSEKIGWKINRFFSAVKWRASRNTRKTWLSSHLEYTQKTIVSRSESIMDGVNLLKSVDEVDTRDNLHNVRKDLRDCVNYLNSRLETEVMSAKNKTEAFDITQIAESMIDRLGYSAFLATLGRLKNRGYFEYEEKLRKKETSTMEDTPVSPI